MSRALLAAIARQKRATQQVGEVMRRDYPIGAELRFIPPGSTVHSKGTVVAHSAMGDRVKVKNAYTAREYWIYLWRVAEAA